MRKKDWELVNRELSWLAFNERVLQEAVDESVPLIERIRFLGIFSNNRDEFFRVRVATLKRIIKLGKKTIWMGVDPVELLDEIQVIVISQQKRFERTYQKILRELRKKDIYLVNEKRMTEKQSLFVQRFFAEEVRSNLVPIILSKKVEFPFLHEKIVYLFIKLSNKDFPEDFKYAIMEIPTNVMNRFVVMPMDQNKKFIMLLDDIIRSQLHQVFHLFDYDTIEAHAFKLTRDAELDIDDDIQKSLIDKLSKSLKGRKTADVTRFVYDQAMPDDMLKFLLRKLKLKETENIIPGGRYQNFKDFIGFPSIGAQALRHRPLPPLPVREFEESKSLLKAIAKKDILLHYPYESFSYIIDILREAAIDPKVKSIEINIYRLAGNSKIINALINAVKNGKDVTALVELQARFDEKNNIRWSDKLQEGGVKVIHGVPGLKVHSKLFLITRKDGKRVKRYAHIGTGNFHEGTANIYTDHSLLTADPRLTNEVAKVFDFFRNNYKVGRFSHLIVSPQNTRRKFVALINKEIRTAQKGGEARIILKLNNLLDEVMVKKLYEASVAGVQVDLVIRGICAVIPGVPGMSENIRCISIVDRFLEHSRILVFHNGGDPQYFLSSADWMGRNLDKRVEVSTPVYDETLKAELQHVLDIQLSDNCKARRHSQKGGNEYVETKGKKRRSQHMIYKFYQHKLDGNL